VDTELPGGAAVRVVAAGPRLAVVWQAQYTEPPGGGAAGPRWVSRGRRSTLAAAGCRVAGAVRRAFWRSGTRGRRWAAAGWRSTHCCAHGRRWPAAGFRAARSTQSFLEELLRVAAAGPPLAFVWQTKLSWERCSTQSLLEEFWAGSHTIFDTPLCDTLSFTHPLSHTSSFTHNFVTHHL